MAKPPRPGEFEVIRRFFAPLAAGFPGAFGLTDDAAVLSVSPGRTLVVTTDALVAGVHFLPDDPPADVAAKVLRVNLSDLAAMGAEPLAYTLAAALPADLDVAWLEAFAGGLAADQDRFGIRLAGGDTVSTPGPLMLTVGAFGTVAEGAELRRSGAKEGDSVFVTGTVGDAALGLIALKGGLAGLEAGHRDAVIGRYRRPDPRTTCGPRLVGLAQAAIDVSDGLVADLGHVCEESGTGAEIETERLPLSAAGRAALAAGEAGWADVVTGGDDYELLFTAPSAAGPKVAELAAELGLAITEIGRVTARSGTEVAGEGRVAVIGRDGRRLALKAPGFRHF